MLKEGIREQTQFENHPYQRNQDPSKDLSFANEEDIVATSRDTFWIILALKLPCKMLKITLARNYFQLIACVVLEQAITDLCYWIVLQLIQESLLVDTSNLFRRRIDL